MLPGPQARKDTEYLDGVVSIVFPSSGTLKV